MGSFTPSDPGYPVLPDVSEVIPASITTTSLRHEEDIQLNAVSTRKPVAKSTTTPTRSPVTRAPVTTKPSTSPVFSPSKLPTLTPTNIPVIPVSFASDANWPNCASVINHIRDQSDCGRYVLVY